MKADWIAAGAVWGFLGVLLGAFGAHGLELSPEAEEWWKTATLYHLIHAPLLVVGGLLRNDGRLGKAPLAFILGGSFIFSGTLYAMALGAPRFLGAITPIGGLGLLLGWAGIALASARRAARP
ncbi:MAG: uncharacterized membrane protein YgdD (TMEM256/DUF423 family) [Chlamydiales bacterium]|jgi:uncharacterized membrane protein YgdD (TMEM256/DUF423 family)